MWGETLHDMVAPIAIYKFTPQEFDNESFSLRFSLKTLTDRRQLLVNPLKFLMLLPSFTNFSLSGAFVAAVGGGAAYLERC